MASTRGGMCVGEGALQLGRSMPYIHGEDMVSWLRCSAAHLGLNVCAEARDAKAELVQVDQAITVEIPGLEEVVSMLFGDHK